MNRLDRAKQFLPFDALKGLREELDLREKKHSRVNKIDFCESEEKILSDTLNALQKGDCVSITYFSEGQYLTSSGIVKNIDAVYRTMTVNGVKIPFDDLSDITIYNF